MILYETLSQPLFLLVLIAFGFLSGLIFDLINLIVFLTNNNKVVRVILDIIGGVGVFFVMLLVSNTFSYGEVRLFIPICFLSAFTLERISIGKIVAKTYLWCYTKFRNFCKLIQKTREKQNGKDIKKI